MYTYLKNMEGYKLKDLKLKEFDSIQEMFNRGFKRINTFKEFITELVEGKEKRVGEELVQEFSKKQKMEDDKEKDDIQGKIDADHQLTKRLHVQEQEELSDAEKATLFQQHLEKRRKHFAAKRVEEKRNKHQKKMFNRGFKRINTFKEFRTELVEGKEKRVGEELVQEFSKKQKMEDDKEKVELKQLMKTILDEEKVTIDAISLAVKSPRIVD
nr:hypothetical protein [Tanacetum cinerariifolium]